MKQILKRTLLPGLMAASLAGVSLAPMQPASADDRVLRDAAIGAGAGIVTGAITGCRSVVGNAATGVGAALAVNGANGLRKKPRYQRRPNRSIVQDVGVGAGAGVVTGAITGNCRGRVLNNAGAGAATGALINILGK
ncbi:hypothetical protein [Nostoc sp. MS1]|uniref:hypothetical protein n=1 Tax=Nostoc sp. MS1 TaxID=2764711 RepID=UPI001CC546C6|nr:hypothetical protein [Nostoc sp. MS1]BCL34411.1 hypothetical protein NSMS1_08580 [Nostoc sp. MS1]